MESADRLTETVKLEVSSRGRGRSVSVFDQLFPSLPEMEMIRDKKETTDKGEEFLEDISDGFEVLKAVPVDFFLPGARPQNFRIDRCQKCYGALQVRAQTNEGCNFLLAANST